jgi:hypothetical protein
VARRGKQREAALSMAPVAASHPRPSRGQLLVSSVLFAFWLLFLAGMAVAA